MAIAKDKNKPKITNELKKKRNEIVVVATDAQLQKLDDMARDLPKYLESRRQEFAKELEKHIEENSSAGTYMPDAAKLPFFEITEHIFKPIIKVAGFTPTYSADEIAIAFDFYMQCTEELNKHDLYIPQKHDFCRMMNISTDMFNNYMVKSTDEQMRETCKKIEDYCSSFVDKAALAGRFGKSIYPIFYQRSVNSRRDNDPIQNNTFVQNNNIVTDKEINYLMNKYLNK